VVATEPVAHYLLVNSSITDKTPKSFAESVEQDTDPSPADLAAVLDLIESREVSALLYNPQTETAVTKQIRDAAAVAAVPVVNVSETLPEGTDYLSWQRQTVRNLSDQLDKAPSASR
jgi:zinc/manganese transport system substrate-binding protein